MDPAMVVAVVSAVIGAAGTVVGAWIQARGRRQREDAVPATGASHPAGGATRAGQAADRELSPDDHR
jgi:hypothetical protein